MLNAKFTCTQPNILKISLGSSNHGLSHSLQGIQRSDSKLTRFTHYHCFVLMRAYSKKRHCMSLRGLIQITSWHLENCRKMSLSKNKFFKAISFITMNQKKWNQFRQIHNQLVCKIWIWPLNALEAVPEAMIAWSQWNFQYIWVRYKRKFGI